MDIFEKGYWFISDFPPSTIFLIGIIIVIFGLLSIIAVLICYLRTYVRYQDDLFSKKIGSRRIRGNLMRRMALNVVTNTDLFYVTNPHNFASEKHKGIKSIVETIVNSGEKDIFSIDTSYSKGYLTEAWIFYQNSLGLGNKLRVLFVHINDFSKTGPNSLNRIMLPRDHSRPRQNKINQKIKQMINSSDYDIIKIKPIYHKEILVAAEIYYIKS